MSLAPRNRIERQRRSWFGLKKAAPAAKPAAAKAEPSGASGRVNRTRAAVIGLAAMAVLTGTGLFYYFGKPEPLIPEGATNADLREIRENLTEEQRPQFQAEMRQRIRNAVAQREQEMDKRIDGYFRLKTQEDRNAYLDNMIGEMQTRMAERRPNGGPPQGRGPNAGPNRPPMPPGVESPNANGGPPQANAAGRPPRQPPSEARQNARMRERLDSSSPEQRAKRQQFREAMRKRMQERGITTPQRGGGPGGGGARGGGGRGGR